jgi:uncharacterized protein
VTFALEELAAAVSARAATWSGLDLGWHVRPAEPNHGKPVVGAELRSATWHVEIMVWVTGEAELETVRLADERTVNKHYELADHGGLEILLDELIGVLVDDRIPGAALMPVPAMAGRSIAVAAGDVLDITDVEGSQVGDLWLIDAADHTRWMSTAHTRDALERLFPLVGESFVDQRYEPMARFVADTSDGHHDMLFPACSPALYAREGLTGHANCADNFVSAASAAGIRLPTVPDPVNLFQRSTPQPDGRLPVRPAASRPGDRVSLQVLRDAVVVLTACAVDFWPTNGSRCTSLLLQRQSGTTPGTNAST